MTEQILVAISDPEKAYDDRYMIEDDIVEFSKGDDRLVYADGQLFLLKKGKLTQDFLPFQKSTICIKCTTNNDAARTKTEYLSEQDLLCRTCRNCGYQWYERPADYKEAP